ncbi:hypothetical protein H9P43_001160 [Blastocladiella emersonii ATCC 22665]|nr:hypothetical protein H9P43_001160 [Blastocladiella emersonii ATCC 22665]
MAGGDTKSHRDLGHLRERLQYYNEQVQEIILARQHPVTGLIPASTAITSHGNYLDAWTRDNVYSVLAVWGLALAYRRIDDETGRAYELEHSVVKCMRGLLFAMMRQAHKVERFKNTQHPLDSLHAKYDTATGSTVVADDGWGHLQIDATSIFLLSLAQMTTSGLRIIYTQDEVDFIQNLVFYVERAYRTPDYGIWERGNKMNHGQPELNSSSIGMVVAAMQAIKGVNLFGARGGPTTAVHALPDEISRNVTILNSALPRESNSKEIDAALLSVIGFPAFAVTDPALVDRTRSEIVEKLGGRYGCKRFLRDGHQAVVEDTSRLHYEPNELVIFEHLECEWPLFFTYLILDGLFLNNPERTAEYKEKLSKCLVRGKFPLVPELYYVPRDRVDAERANPSSQDREPNENLPLVWAQSLFILGNLLDEKLLYPTELDPLGRRLGTTMPARDTVVQIVLIAEDASLQSRLLQYGIQTQTADQVQPVRITNPSALRDAYSFLGSNAKLGMTGRPKRPVGVLGTSKLYRIGGDLYAFTPAFMTDQFYLSYDVEYLINSLESELLFLHANWSEPGRPTMVVNITHSMLTNERGPSAGLTAIAARRRSSLPSTASRRSVLNFFMSLKTGRFGSVALRLGRLGDFVHTSCIESLEFMASHGQEWESILGNYSCDPLTCAIGKLKLSEQKMREKEALKLMQAGLPTLGDRATLSTASSPQEFVVESSLQSPLTGGFPEWPLTGRSGSSQESKDLPLSPLGAGTRPNGQAPTNGQSPPLAPSPGPGPGPVERAPSVSSGTELPPGGIRLVLGDAAHIADAVRLLRRSSDLYEQVDLLHYLASCAGLDHQTDLGTVRALLEEVYTKALGRNWSIVRLAAGLLRKTASSLTINMTDLLVRQKLITIGFNYVWHSAEHLETTVSAPMSPSAIADLVFAHCADPREAVLVQEMITNLGAMIRSEPELFQGMIRVRVHYMLQAMRDELSWVRGCDEREAMEALYVLSPHQVATLMYFILGGDSGRLITQSALASPGQQPHRKRERTDSNVRVAHREEPALCIPNPPGSSSSYRRGSETVVVSVQSAGYSDGNFAKILLDGTQVPGLTATRGIHIAVIDRSTGVLLESCVFDTHYSRDESDDLADFLSSLDGDMVVAVAAQDDVVENLTPRAIEQLEAFGSTKIRGCRYRDSFALIGVRGGAAHEVVEAHAASMSGPTEPITRTIAVDQGNAGHGEWLRRRKNNGALNRVPKQFYVRVWHVLERSQGLAVDARTLPRDPTVADKTPGEFNFAVMVDGFLDGFRDSAERQLAVELLSWLHSVLGLKKQRVPAVINLAQIVRDAIAIHWKKRKTGSGVNGGIAGSVSDLLPTLQSSDSLAALATGADESASTGSVPALSRKKLPRKINPDALFGKNEALARKMFYDLPTTSTSAAEASTLQFLQEALAAHLPALALDAGEMQALMADFS